MPDAATAQNYPPDLLNGGTRHNGGIASHVEPRRSVPRGPLFSRRRLVIAVALIGALALFWYGTRRGTETGGGVAANDPAVVVKVPGPGDRVLRQSQVGAELKQGYDGQLVIDGHEIPEDQLEGAIPASSPEYDPKLGVRPNNKNKLFFVPGAGKRITTLPPGEVQVVLHFWPIQDGPRLAKTISWTFSVI